MRFALQCVAAALASLAMPVAGALWTLSSDPVVNANGSIDDAPERAAMLFLLASPGFVVCIGVFFATSAALLRSFSRLSLGRLYLVNLGVALVVAAVFARDGYAAFGTRDAVISFASFGVLSFTSLALGSTAWWLLWPCSTRSDKARRPTS